MHAFLEGCAIDEISLAIIRFLQQDGRMSNTEIAHRLEISEGTVRARINKLISDGVLHIVAAVDPVKVGKKALAIIGLQTSLPERERVAEKLSAFPEIRFMAYTTGNYDIILEVYAESNEQLLEFVNQNLSTIEGIQKAELSLQLKIVRDSYTWL
ncbi:Lrp/AsnC family transcriptional regulator [Ferroacidibacillus organovorans]|uniref:HTH asnC-type domain-containing protein n=1 Tax=Ferroacidibacillus organovorans TaxID=1765683 RepID=A0A101XT86_9BACL|nr:Lrp/AsnC family transcriptional regulator [Ferroacidibacillus organovorans]KUO97075.1 hypothetical protein ATW55_12215 [Ferroacidibacillus organovorans]